MAFPVEGRNSRDFWMSWGGKDFRKYKAPVAGAQLSQGRLRWREAVEGVGEAITWGIASCDEALGFYSKGVGKGLRILKKGTGAHIVLKIISLSVIGLEEGRVDQ